MSGNASKCNIPDMHQRCMPPAQGMHATNPRNFSPRLCVETDARDERAGLSFESMGRGCKSRLGRKVRSSSGSRATLDPSPSLARALPWSERSERFIHPRCAAWKPAPALNWEPHFPNPCPLTATQNLHFREALVHNAPRNANRRSRSQTSSIRLNSRPNRRRQAGLIDIFLGIQFSSRETNDVGLPLIKDRTRVRIPPRLQSWRSSVGRAVIALLGLLFARL